MGEPPGKPGAQAVGKAALSKILNQLKGIEKLIESERSTYEVSQFEKISGYAGMVETRLKTVEDSIRSISAAGLTIAKGSEVNQALNNVSTLFDKLAGNAKLGADAVVALSKNMEMFPMLAAKSKEYAESIAAQAASLDRLGISFQQYTQNVDIAQNMFSMSQKQILALNQGLKDFADEMKMLPSVVSSNFQLVAKSLSYEGPKVVDQFKKMQQMSSQTGVSVTSLMSGFGERLDTMSGAAQFVGQLNAILGTNAFSPNEILMMDESERMVRIREVIRAHPIYDDILSGGKLGKFALNTLSKVVGFSKEDTRKYLSGNMDAATQNRISGKKRGEAGFVEEAVVKEKEKASVKSGLMDKSASQLEAAMNKLSESYLKQGLGTEELYKTIKQNSDLMKNLYLSREDAAIAGERGRQIGVQSGVFRGQDGGDIFAQAARPKATQAQITQASNLLSDIAVKSSLRFGALGIDDVESLMTRIQKQGGFKTNLKSEDFTDTFNRAIFRYPQIGRLMAAYQTLPDNASGELARSLGNIIELAGGAAGMDKEEVKQFEAQLKEAESPKLALAFRKADDQVTSFEARILRGIKDAAGPEKLGIYRYFLRKARESDNEEDFLGEAEYAITNLSVTDSSAEEKFSKARDAATGLNNNQTTPSTQPSSLSPGQIPVFPGTLGDEGASIQSPAGTGGLSAQGIANLVNTLSAKGGLKFLFKVGNGTAKEIAATAFVSEGIA